MYNSTQQVGEGTESMLGEKITPNKVTVKNLSQYFYLSVRVLALAEHGCKLINCLTVVI